MTWLGDELGCSNIVYRMRYYVGGRVICETKAYGVDFKLLKKLRIPFLYLISRPN